MLSFHQPGTLLSAFISLPPVHHPSLFLLCNNLYFYLCFSLPPPAVVLSPPFCLFFLLTSLHPPLFLPFHTSVAHQPPFHLLSSFFSRYTSSFATLINSSSPPCSYLWPELRCRPQTPCSLASSSSSSPSWHRATCAERRTFPRTRRRSSPSGCTTGCRRQGTRTTSSSPP